MTVQTLRVLVCDDEPGMRLAAFRTLRDFSFHMQDVNETIQLEVEQAETGEQAVEMIDANPPHILLLDHKLPGISGLDVLEHIAGRGLELLTIMISAYASIETAVRATRQGAYDFLAKPFTPAELRNSVRKAAERVIVAQHARVLAHERRQVRFQSISVLAHELKAPLGAVEGYLRVLKDRTAGDDPVVYDQMIDRSLSRMEFMQKMIVDLLDLTRIEAGQKRRTIGDVELCEIARRSIETVAAQAAERGIAVQFNPEGPVPFRADAREMEIVFNNLISNAVKYNRDNGRVEISIQGTSERGAAIVVRDTGIGLAPEECEKLFNDFVRIKNSKTRNILGSGLGLSIVKKIAQLYNGAATVSSVPDEGSTFTIMLGDTAGA